ARAAPRQSAAEHGRGIEPGARRRRRHRPTRHGPDAGKGQPAEPVHRRAFAAARPLHPEIELADRRVIGEERPVELLEHRVEDHKGDPERDREDTGPADRSRRRGIRRLRAVEPRYVLMNVKRLRHDPTPRKSSATCPTRKAYHTLMARKTASHLRIAACSSLKGCRQKYQ